MLLHSPVRRVRKHAEDISLPQDRFRHSSDVKLGSVLLWVFGVLQMEALCYLFLSFLSWDQEEDNSTYNFRWYTSYACPEEPLECMVTDPSMMEQYDLSR